MKNRVLPLHNVIENSWYNKLGPKKKITLQSLILLITTLSWISDSKLILAER